jgi:hypothetical protein
MERIRWSLGFSNGVAVDCIGRSGGLGLWWRDGVDVTVRPWSQNYIDVVIKFEGKEWRFTGVYGEPKTELRARTWEALRYLRAQDDRPWLCAGDFNEILRAEEQLGGNPRSERQMTAFRDCLMDCNLSDIGFSGYEFTWNNRREAAENVQVRLDRATATASFLDIFPMTHVEHIMMEESDHLALLIHVREDIQDSGRKTHRSFQFEEMWLKHDGYDDMVKDAWLKNGIGSCSNLDGLWRQLRGGTQDIHRWSFSSFGSVKAGIKSLRRKLEEAKSRARSEGSNLEIRNIEQKLHEVFEKEEIMYKQHS